MHTPRSSHRWQSKGGDEKVISIGGSEEKRRRKSGGRGARRHREGKRRRMLSPSLQFLIPLAPSEFEEGCPELGRYFPMMVAPRRKCSKRKRTNSRCGWKTEVRPDIDIYRRRADCTPTSGRNRESWKANCIHPLFLAHTIREERRGESRVQRAGGKERTAVERAEEAEGQ